MKFALENYKSYNLPYYLDGRYFNKVLKNEQYDSFIETPLIIQIKETKNNIESPIIPITNIEIFEDVLYPSIFRLIIEEIKNNQIISRHSNLIIINHLNNHITRFEPIKSYKYNDIINNYLFNIFNRKYIIYLDKRHPQNNNDNYCNAYVLKYAYFYIKRLPIYFEKNKNSEIICSDDDIQKFTHSVKYLYGPLDYNIDGPPDIEFGLNPTQQGVLIGGLGGAALGGIVGGGSGLILGGLLGASTGALIGSSASKNKNY